jgi:hypothetical protein
MEEMSLLGALAAAKVALYLFTNSPATSDRDRNMLFRIDPQDFLQIREIEKMIDDTLKANSTNRLTES